MQMDLHMSDLTTLSNTNPAKQSNQLIPVLAMDIKTLKCQ
jgi:hypothetical protein